MMDVALVAEQMLNAISSSELHFVLSPLSSSSKPKASFLFLIALHDVGKLTPEFQYLREDIIQFDKALYRAVSGNTKHGKLGLDILVPVFKKRLGLDSEGASLLASFTVSHHGKFEWNYDFNAERYGNKDNPWRQLQLCAIEWLKEQFELVWAEIKIDPDLLTPEWLTYVAGLCSVADWLGSDTSEDRFPYIYPARYGCNRVERSKRARQLVDKLNLKKPLYCRSDAMKNSTAECYSFLDVFGFAPRKAQRAVEKIAAQKSTSMMTIIETEMGSGKTESAFFLADAMVRNSMAHGFYIAMPSQATANQLFYRTNRFLENHPAKFSNVETHLLHGNSELNSAYQGLIAKAVDMDGEADSCRAVNAVLANEWFCARKRGLLASCGVGTIDQLLMAGLKVKHNFVRLFGLSRRTVILDEVHSLDAYQIEMLNNLLTWLAKLRCPVIILSATLPKAMRESLFSAYLLGEKIELERIDQPYPRISFLNENGLPDAIHIEEKNENREAKKSIVIHIAQPQQIIAAMAEHALAQIDNAQGKDVIVCIVNTVDEAQKLHSLVTNKLNHSKYTNTRSMLFHARFLLGDKLNIENEIERLIGPNKKNRNAVNCHRPWQDAGLILIGTQVLEQSLNYDASIMLTACPPIDLLLQRIGRLHRFAINNTVRAQQFNAPRLHVWLSECDETKDLDPFEKFGATGLIYPPYILEKTQSLLKAKAEGDQICFEPSQVMDDWIEAVYGDLDAIKSNDPAKDWEKCWLYRHEQKLKAHLASEQLFDAQEEEAETLFSNAQNKFEEDDIKIATRLATRSITLVFLEEQNEQWVTCFTKQPCLLSSARDKRTITDLKQSSVNISKPAWVEHFLKDDYATEMWQKNPEQKKYWKKSALLLGCIPVCLGLDGKYKVKQIGDLWLDLSTGVNWRLNKTTKEGTKDEI